MKMVKKMMILESEPSSFPVVPVFDLVLLGGGGCWLFTLFPRGVSESERDFPILPLQIYDMLVICERFCLFFWQAVHF